MPSSEHANRTREKLGLTFLSAHFGPSRKLVTLTEVSTLLQVRGTAKRSLALTNVVPSLLTLRCGGKMISWSRRRDLNPRPTDYKSVALPTELRRLTLRLAHTSSIKIQSEARPRSHDEAVLMKALECGFVNL